MRRFFFLIIIFLIQAHFADAQVIHIPEDHPAIQEGIDAANTGDTVLVAEGRYYENINFRGKAITLASRFILDGDTSHISKTIIDGSRPANPDSASVVFMVSREDTTSVLCGFTIQGGKGALWFLDREVCRAGGGILIIESGCKIIHNRIIYNNIIDDAHVILGGGMFIGVWGRSKPVMVRENCISFNTIESVNQTGGAGISLGGTGVTDVIIEKNTISHNTAIMTGNWPRSHGGGISVVLIMPDTATIIVRDNEISYNKLIGQKTIGAGVDIVYREPGGRFTDLDPSPLIYNNIISHNFSQEAGGGLRIETIWINHSNYSVVSPQPIIMNNTIINNSASWGSGFIIRQSYPLFINNTNRNETVDTATAQFVIDEQSVLYMHKNRIQNVWKDKRIPGLFDRYYMKINNNRLKVAFTDSGEPPDVSVLPPLWREWWVLTGYGLVIILIFLWYRRFLLL